MQPRQNPDSNLRVTDADLRALAILGQAVRIARVRAAMSQRRLAARSRVSQSAISRVERGAVRGLHLKYFARVILALGDSMTLVGCPHGHDCDFARQWRAAQRHVAFDAQERTHDAPEEGMTLFELMRRAERAGEVDVLGDPVDDPGGSPADW